MKNRNLLGKVAGVMLVMFLIQGTTYMDLNDREDLLKKTPLITAVQERKIDKITNLLKLKEVQKNINLKDIFRKTALHYAVEAGLPEMVKLLLDAGANPDLKKHKHRTPLARAHHHLKKSTQDSKEYNQYQQIIKLLHKKRSGQSLKRTTPSLLKTVVSLKLKAIEIRKAIENGNVEQFKNLIKHADPNYQFGKNDKWGKGNMTYLMLAAQMPITYLQDGSQVREPEQIVEHLLARKYINLNLQDQSQRTALHHAVETARPTIVKLLIGAGANIHLKDSNKKTPLELAQQGFEMFQSPLLQGGYRPEKFKYEKIIQYLDEQSQLDANLGARYYANVNLKAKASSKQTHLMIAAKKGETEHIVYLLTRQEVRDDINLQDDFGETAFSLALNSGHPEIATLLIDAGADVKFKYRDELTPLMLSAQRGEISIVKKLLTFTDVQTTINLKDVSPFDQMTALHYAIKSGRPKIVQLLLDAGANRDLTDHKDQTPLKLAETIFQTLSDKTNAHTRYSQIIKLLSEVPLKR